MKKMVLFITFFISLILSSCGNPSTTTATGNPTRVVTFIVAGEIYGDVKVVNNGSVSMPEDPKYQDYEFLGWYIGPEMETKFINKNIDKDLVIYAKFNFPDGGGQNETTTTS